MRTLQRSRQGLAVLQPIVLPPERHCLLGRVEEPMNDLHLLTEHLETLAARGEGKAERPMLSLVPSSTQANLYPTARYVVHRSDRLRQHRRMTERHR